MRLCLDETADVLIDGKPYRFDTLKGFAYVMERERYYRGLEFVDELATLSRLVNEARDSYDKAGRSFVAPKKIKERLQLLSNFKPTAIHGDRE
jgi:hypothetical protein